MPVIYESIRDCGGDKIRICCNTVDDSLEFLHTDYEGYTKSVLLDNGSGIREMEALRDALLAYVPLTPVETLVGSVEEPVEQPAMRVSTIGEISCTELTERPSVIVTGNATINIHHHCTKEQ